MPRMDKLSSYRTRWETSAMGARGSVTYCATRIVAWDSTTVTLDSGGWQTVTTKRKMVQASRQFALGFTVHQERGQWYVTRFGRSPEGYLSAGEEHGARTMPFEDGMTFPKGPMRQGETWGYATMKEARKAAE